MRDTIDEQWRPIEGYEGLYEVSDLGRVRSFKWGKERILSPRMNGMGYIIVDLCKEGKKKTFLVHRLVGQAFIPNPEGLPEINHKDENPSNDQADNLEWCDRKYNINYGTRTERAIKNIVQAKINNGTADPELCGIGDEKEYQRLYRQKNLEKILEYHREYNREWRRRKKQEKKKDNKPSETSLW